MSLTLNNIAHEIVPNQKYSTISFKKGQHPQCSQCMNASPYSLDPGRAMLHAEDLGDCIL